MNFQYRRCRSIYRHRACGTSSCISARLAQSVEHETLNLGVVGSSPTLGESFLSANVAQSSGNLQRGSEFKPHFGHIISSKVFFQHSRYK